MTLIKEILLSMLDRGFVTPLAESSHLSDLELIPDDLAHQILLVLRLSLPKLAYYKTIEELQVKAEEELRKINGNEID